MYFSLKSVQKSGWMDMPDPALTLTHNAVDRRVKGSADSSQKRGTASLQSPPGVSKCSILDRDTSNNSCQCAGS
ncbi:MAG: hypothetical protein AB1631_29215 [Acidobacteriota bacterium]